MARRRLHAVLTIYCLLATFPVLVQAQSVKDEKNGSQSTATLATTLRYRSVFEHYHSYDEIQGGSWRESNDAVGRVGSEHLHAGNEKLTIDTEEIESLDMSMEGSPPVSLPDQKSSHKHNHGPKP